jgi:hypothetical protein
MKRFDRIALLAVLSCLSLLAIAPAAEAAFGITKEHFEAGTCQLADPGCEYESSPSVFFTQAAGHPGWGLTSVELNSRETPLLKQHEPEGALKRLRIDVPPGLAANPEALPTCTKAEFEADSCGAETEVGETELTVFVLAANATIKGQVYNLQPEAGLPLEFGIHVQVPLVANEHIFLKGHVSYEPEPVLEARGVPSGDYHEWFEIDEISKSIPIVKSKLLFKGTAGDGNFLTVPSQCSTSTTSYAEVESYEGQVSTTPTTTPVGVTGCDSVPFAPTASVTPAPSQYDSPDGATTVLKVPQFAKSTNSSDLKDAHITLPEGLTLNPSAAHGLLACKPAEFAGSKCLEASRLGSVTIETDLPPHTLVGYLYLGGPASGPITGPEYTLYVIASGAGVVVKLQGKAVPNASTGRVTVTFLENPRLPFSELVLSTNGGPHAPLANSASCGAVSTNSEFTPWTGLAAFASSSPFTTTGCPSPVPFSLAQSTTQSTTKAGAFTSFTFNLARNDGQQNLSSLQTTLPAGLVGLIPSIKRCATAQALAGSCPSTSQIGTASATAGVGTEPYGFSGPVYLTEAIGGAPYGLFIPIEAAAGPFDLGQVKTYVTLNVDPHSGSVIASATLPRIVGGVPLHLRGLSVAVTKPNFLFNPTYCGGLTTNSLLGAIQGATSTTTSALPVASCSSLPFKPAFAAASPTAPSRANGASLTVSYTQPDHQADIRSVVAQLPKELPSRLTTLHNACAEATFANGNNYKACPAGSKVGSVTVTTPVLPEKLTGPAYLVSHGGAAFPNLDLILEGDHGVKVVIEGTTNIKSGITTSSFPTIPDVPVSGFELKLPTGPNSALGSFDSLCAKPLFMPTTITAQSGTVSKQNLHLSIGSCKIKLLSHKIKNKKLVVRVQVFTAGRVSVTSPGLHTVYRKVGGPGIVTIKVPVSIKGKKTLASGRSLKVRARVGFNPKHKNEFHSAAFAKVTFRH